MNWKETLIPLLGLLLFVACGPTTTTPEPEPTALSGRITFAGSTTLQPLADVLGQAFTEQHPEVTLDIAAGGSVVGIQAVHDGTVDIGMASRSLSDEEAEGIEQHQVAVDVIAVVVNAANPVADLALDDLSAIYQGEITNWSEVGGEDEPIRVVIRGENSGTRGAFDKIVLDGETPEAPELETAVTAGDMAAIVGDNANAVGYVGFGNLESDIKMVSIDSILPSEEAARDGSYSLVRPLIFLTGPLTQPLAQRFIDFTLSEDGQELVIDSGWVPAR
jgi:phosphate transport system substrate-binding protein